VKIRDRETADIAVQSALTGHLVYPPIHANDSVGVLFRMIDLGAERYMIASTLIGVSTQRMIRPNLRTLPHTLHAYGRRTGSLRRRSTGKARQYSMEGAPVATSAEGIGYQGRIGVFETMIMTDSIRKLMLSNANAIEIKAQAMKEGMVTMKKDGMLKSQRRYYYYQRSDAECFSPWHKTLKVMRKRDLSIQSLYHDKKIVQGTI